MSEAAQDNWSTEEYQNAAAFVPKLATKVVQWLDVQPDDKILDIGCGGLSPPLLPHLPSPSFPAA